MPVGGSIVVLQATTAMLVRASVFGRRRENAESAVRRQPSQQLVSRASGDRRVPDKPSRRPFSSRGPDALEPGTRGDGVQAPFNPWGLLDGGWRSTRRMRPGPGRQHVLRSHGAGVVSHAAHECGGRGRRGVDG